jgi:hypothetical protein
MRRCMQGDASQNKADGRVDLSSIIEDESRRVEALNAVREAVRRELESNKPESKKKDLLTHAWQALNSPILICILSGFVLTAVSARWSEQQKSEEQKQDSEKLARESNAEVRYRAALLGSLIPKESLTARDVRDALQVLSGTGPEFAPAMKSFQGTSLFAVIVFRDHHSGSRISHISCPDKVVAFELAVREVSRSNAGDIVPIEESVATPIRKGWHELHDSCVVRRNASRAGVTEVDTSSSH